MKFILYYLLVLILLLIGCKPKNNQNDLSNLTSMIDRKEKNEILYKNSLGENHTNVLYKLDIYKSMAKIGITNLLDCNISHMGYAKVNKRWLETQYSFELKRFYFEHGVLNWQEIGTFHCEDYAQGAMFLARTLNFNNENRIKGASFAVGVVYYFPENRRTAVLNTHAINVVITEDMSVLFYEPQWQKFINLTQSEISSIYYWQF